MAEENEIADLARRKAFFQQEVADALARQIDRERPLPTDDRIRHIAREEVQVGLKALLNTDEVRRLAREEIISRLRLIGLHADDDKAEETGSRVRRALTFPESTWTFIKWAGGVCFAAIATAFATVLAALIGRGH